MATGLPIIATYNRGHLQLINNGENGFLVNLDRSEEFFARLLYLINLKEKFNIIKNCNSQDEKK